MYLEIPDVKGLNHSCPLNAPQCLAKSQRMMQARQTLVPLKERKLPYESARESQWSRITWDEPFNNMTNKGCIHTGQKPEFKHHLNKNTFLNELATIDLEYKMKMEQMLIAMNLSVR